MSFWNDLKKSGQEAAGKAKDLAEVTRLQLAQKEQERKLEKLYGQLGKACYDAAVPGEDSPFFEFISAITQTLEEIEQSKEQQRLLKGGVRCAACGALMDAAALFCTNCGAEKAESDGIVLGKLFLHGTIHDYELNCIKKEIRFAQSSSKLSGKLRFV